ncbi:MAG TPA: CUAEP/CCAEP-tail radical SAM protein [Ktedonobacterales bacterium]
MRDPGGVLLVACYELGHQPLSLASPLAMLRARGFRPAVVDASLDAVDDDVLRAARLVAIATPMHTALRVGVGVAERARAVNPAAHICFYGLYAHLNADYLLREWADSLISGEYEEALCGLAAALDRGDSQPPPGVRTREQSAAPVLRRVPLSVPARDALPPLDRYAWLDDGQGHVVKAGYVEATRGCLHTCNHCPITPVYGGRFFAVPRDVVLADIRAQVAAGARHITFGDPDFLNGPKHSLMLARALHSEFPEVTFDATIKVEHIIERHDLFAELGALGCSFVVSAVESLSPRVLERLGKGHTRADVSAALGILRDARIPMRPTFVAFTPWTTADDFMEMLRFVAEEGLAGAVDAVQYPLRLLIPPGSPIATLDDAPAWLTELDEPNFSWGWRHPDPRMDALQAALWEHVARIAPGQPGETTFVEVAAIASERLGLPGVPPPARSRRPIPHLTEAWFC